MDMPLMFPMVGLLLNEKELFFRRVSNNVRAILRLVDIS